MEGAASNRVIILVRVTAKAQKYKGYITKNTYGALRIVRFIRHTISANKTYNYAEKKLKK